MKWLSLVCLLFSCSHGSSRVLSQTEMDRLGLKGIIFDAPICPTAFDKLTGESRVAGACELVTCQPEQNKLTCRAVPEPQRRNR